MGEKQQKTQPEPAQSEKNYRPPVVAVLGHVDHGKTTLLDNIRKSNVADKETGGITQHIGAYQIERNGKLITFLDTPGHEAFSEMRRRGAHVADLAILVIAEDEGIKPQTLEAAKHIKDAGIPYLVALNKMDRPGADPMRVKKELAEHDILVEEWGGKVPAMEISAKSGNGIQELLDMLMLVWEVEEKSSDSSGAERAGGVVIESRLDPRRGPTATMLVTKGVLKRGDSICCGEVLGKVRIIENFKGDNIEEAPVSTPVLVIGLEDVPMLGDTCEVIEDVEKMRAQLEAARRQREEQKKSSKETAPAVAAESAPTISAKNTLFVILKTDVKGSEEAIADALKSIKSDEVALKISGASVGDVTEQDVKSAEATKAIIVGFRVNIPKTIAEYARQRNVKVLQYDLIYECLMGVRKELSTLLPSEIIKKPFGKLTLLAIFKREKDGLIIGGRVTSGKVPRGAWCDIVRAGKIVSEGKIREIKTGKEDVEEVREGQECGLLYVGRGETPEEKDTVEAYEKEERSREL